MLTPVFHLPRVRTQDEQALLTVVNRWRKFPWERFLIGWCAAFHGLIAFTLAFAPQDQILNAGTRPVFDIASRYVWFALFLTVAIVVSLLREQRSTWMQIAAWVSVLFLGGMWLTAFALAVLKGEGSAIGVVVWPFLYGPWAIVAFLSLGKR